MESEKTCPKCPSFPRMDEMDGMKTVIPVIAGYQDRLMISGATGLRVKVYRCPRCHFVELYEVNDE